MKKKIRFSIAAMLAGALLLLTMLAACGNGAGTKNVPVSDITAAVSAALGKTDSLTESDGMFLGLTKQNAEALGDHAVLINVYGTNIDEYGVFKAGSGMSAKDLKAVADDYLSKRLSSWMEEYMPEEKPKLTNAEVRVSGDYVMYCILSDADKAAAFQAFEGVLKG